MATALMDTYIVFVCNIFKALQLTLPLKISHFLLRAPLKGIVASLIFSHINYSQNLVERQIDTECT